MDPNYLGKFKAKRLQDNCEPLNYKTMYGSQAGKAIGENFVNIFMPRLPNLARHLVSAKLKNDTSQQTSSSSNSHDLDTTQGQLYTANSLTIKIFV